MWSNDYWLRIFRPNSTCPVTRVRSSETGSPSKKLGTPPFLLGAPSFRHPQPSYLLGVPSFRHPQRSYLLGVPSFQHPQPSKKLGAPPYLLGMPSKKLGVPPYLLGSQFRPGGVPICSGGLVRNADMPSFNFSDAQAESRAKRFGVKREAAYPLCGPGRGSDARTQLAPAPYIYMTLTLSLPL